jgi:hypothetical protein
MEQLPRENHDSGQSQLKQVTAGIVDAGGS